MNDNFRQDIFNLLTQIPSRKLDGLRELWAELGYDQTNSLISTRSWPTSEAESLAEPPRVIATTATNGDFRIIYGRLNDSQLRLTPQRPIINRLIQDNPFGLFIFSNADQTAYHLVNVKYDQLRPNRFLKPVRSESEPVRSEYGNIFRRISIAPGERLRTATERLSLLDVETMPRDLSPLTVQQRHDEAFDVESVTKEFYKEVARLFTDLVGGERKEGKKTRQGQNLLRLPSTVDDQTRQEFAVRLMGRLLFCWFLRKKQSDHGEPLIPAEVLSLEAMPNNLYHELLEPLFFETLNQQVANRKPKFQQGHWAKIPFLNGGLFEAHADDFYHPTHVNTLVVPDSWLKRLFELFERFNFTIQENTPLDIEIAVDPEMLGKIFENLLAEINPETGETARKATGSYYTPRPIVDYMVDESLKQYLLNFLNLSCFQNLLGLEANLNALFSYGNDTNPFDEATTTRLIQALDELKILDPACGSGAFPMGVLQKVLLLLQKLDPQNKKWQARQLDKTRHLTDPRARELAREMIERAFANKQLDYGRKLFLIQNCIYGVDIQPIAVEIAKLRCFLSLVIDMPIDERQDNRGIMALPNLEFKFICANTLIGLSQSKEFADSLAATEIRELKTLATDYLTSYGTAKARLKTEFEAVQQRMGKKLGQWRGQTEALQLLNWHHFEHATCAWFDPALMLGVKDGFDVVIGNPPYIDSEGMVNRGQKELRDFIAKNFQFTKGNWDIYIAFFEVGLELLNEHGNLGYITPDKWVSKPFGDELRKKTLTNIHTILMAGREVFTTANVDSIVSFFSKKKSTHLKICEYKNGKLTLLNDVDKNILKPPYALDSLFSKNLNFLIKLDFQPHRLLDMAVCENACATADAYKLKPLILNLEAQSSFNKNQFRVINTGTIDKYITKWGSRAMVYLGDRYLLPIVDRKIFTHHFTNSYGSKAIRPKLIIKSITLLHACLDDIGDTVPGKSTLVICNDDINILKFLLGLLNSSLPIFYIKEKYSASSYNTGINFTKDMLNNLPLPEVPTKTKVSIITLVDQIISAKRANPQADTSAMESAIDRLVYELYGLTAAEIALVEGRL